MAITKRDIANIGDCVTGNVQSTTDRSVKLSHEWQYAAVDTSEVTTPNGTETYYVLSEGNHVLAANNGHPAAWASGTTYYTRTADLRVEGSRISGVGTGGSGGTADAVMTHEYTVDTSGTGTYWTIGGGADDPIDDKTKCAYEVVMTLTGSNKIIVSPMANVADSEDYNPIYVPAEALLTISGGSLMMKVPLSWVNIIDGTTSGGYTLVVRATPIVSDNA